MKVYRLAWGDGLMYIGVTASTLGERVEAHRRARPSAKRAGRYSREVGERLRRGEPYVADVVSEHPSFRAAMAAEAAAIEAVTPTQRANLPGRTA